MQVETLVLAINAGSSSLKSALFECGAEAPPVEAQAPRWHQEISFGKPDSSASSVFQAVEQVIEAISAHKEHIAAVGHRVVHGGDVLGATILIDDNVVRQIHELQKFAPLHNKLNADGIQAAQNLLPGAKQIAVFDTSFHRTIPDEAAIYPLPYDWYQHERIKRYGFHGINHEYVTHRAASMLGIPVSEANLIVCHLGSGCSLSAIAAGKSIDNTMGFTPLEGLMMGTRSGSVDPGIILKVMREKNIQPDEMDRLLNKESGLLGVSGVSNDLRKIMQAATDGNARASLAVAMFNYRLQTYIGAMLAHLPKLDGIVFTAGIGENAASVRAAACSSLRIIGGKLDREKNESAQGDMRIDASDSAIPMLVIRAREEWQIFRECWRLVFNHLD